MMPILSFGQRHRDQQKFKNHQGWVMMGDDGWLDVVGNGFQPVGLLADCFCSGTPWSNPRLAGSSCAYNVKVQQNRNMIKAYKSYHAIALSCLLRNKPQTHANTKLD